ncbi:hypothetical protein H9654_16295 [Stenotrophomonas sp. Sa5BUN4]|jgi:hypothetical protein|uniref:Uncharacterized protein n=1 Tax=Stenotrophomonas lacuserhaii TaxID=2760084 RepID=A0A8X8FYF8_9GAMM|nr:MULTISPECIES: hypothetical protein [Stenotrophomonas]KIP86844.1 hypothetical protein SN15_05310 [Stenotrophomonas maltophilia]MBD7955758.1 hypothetical protein [Stenotrophomonas pennii]MBD8643695.1 hypothetical protein [Stenotrophomonas sp. CFBP 13724]MDX3930512.1 hypothetical protein [Stenotrophomonas sp.]MDY1034997.1 hypothetical protein [Stenotrophomonas sp. CFBP8980]
MDYGRQDLADQVRDELQDSYQRHGCGPEFWNTYQQVLARLVPEGRERTQVTNDMALLIEQLGIVRRAQLVPPADPPSR